MGAPDRNPARLIAGRELYGIKGGTQTYLDLGAAVAAATSKMLTDPDTTAKRAGRLIGLFLAVLFLAECGGGSFTSPQSPLAQPQSSPQLSVSPTTINMGNVLVGNSNSQSIVLTNVGTGSVTVTQASASGTGFSVSGLALPLTLPSNGVASFSAVFSPSAAGGASGDIALVSNAVNSPVEISLSGEGVNSHSVALSWVASVSPNIVGYNVYRGSASSGPYTRLNSSTITVTTYTDRTPQAGQTYFYVVTAVSSNGSESGYSNEAEATIPTP